MEGYKDIRMEGWKDAKQFYTSARHKVYDCMADKIRCAHILVEKQSVALEVLEKLKKGESFARLAEEYSMDGTRKRGGDLGYFGRGVMVREFEDAAFKLNKGETSGPVKTQFGYHIIRRLE